MTADRVVIEGVTPQVDCGAFPIKRVEGDTVIVEADIFADGHDVLSCVVLYRETVRRWCETPMERLVNDRLAWRVHRYGKRSLPLYDQRVGRSVQVVARDLSKRVMPANEVSIRMRIGGIWSPRPRLAAPAGDATYASGVGAGWRSRGVEARCRPSWTRLMAAHGSGPSCHA